MSEPTRAATDAARRSCAERRTEIARETGAVASDLLDRIRSARKPSDVRALASGFGTLIDKARLLDDAVTERVEITEGERRPTAR